VVTAKSGGKKKKRNIVHVRHALKVVKGNDGEIEGAEHFWSCLFGEE
jgi:hypothetical protein